MSLLLVSKNILNCILEAIFPQSEAEKALIAIREELVWQIFPRAPFSSIPESCALFAYKNKIVSSLVWSLKYKKSAHAARLCGFAIWQTLRTYIQSGSIIIVVPMPISKQRRRERGFNQCELIIDEIERLERNYSTNFTKVYFSPISFSRKLLTRPRHIARQTLKDRQARLEGAHDLFAVNPHVLEKLKNQLNITTVTNTSFLTQKYLIFVIDDVVTTGSTMREAIQTLRNAGLENTWGLALAH